jgi:hypothetical protein
MKRIKQAFDPLASSIPGRSSGACESAVPAVGDGRIVFSARLLGQTAPAAPAGFELECPDAQACRRNPSAMLLDVRASDPAG